MQTETQCAIAVRGLEKRFNGRAVVQGLNLEVRAGEIFGLVGPDGAGKTTTLRMLAGILPADAGEMELAGVDVVRHPERAKKFLSYMPQRFGLYEDLTVDENIHFYAELFGVRAAERAVRGDQLLKAAGMQEFRKRRAGQLSGGMKQKLGLVCALIHHPRVVLLDEPTTGVDPVSRRDFWRILYELLAEGVAILLSTAYLDEAERCHRVALLHEGRLLFSDAPDALKKRMPEAIYSIESRDPRRVRVLLEGLRGISGMVVHGDALRVVVGDAQLGLDALQAQLKQAGASFGLITQVEPTMEDLFVNAVMAEGSHHG
ncbi:MAG: ABC transporter ATP-binding protein [Acidobacteriota bacterium]|nr:ABC transporter ATP-binding protein [Acidobacteriota bacterium]